MIRSIFRLAEYLQGNNGYLLHHEVYLYLFDALLMFIIMVIFNPIHPYEIGRLLGLRKTLVSNSCSPHTGA